jgi:hypothetical protein
MNAVAKVAAQPVVLRPQNLTELTQFAQMAARSSMVPRDYIGKPENVMVAIQMGSEIGLAPMQALQNISVISGRPAVWGDAMLGLCRQSPLCEDIEERSEGEGDKLVAICNAKRVGKKPVEGRFSVDDAKKAGLWNKAGPWQQYPKRMLQMRARGFALRDAFPDVLRGLVSAEEASDMPAADTFNGPTIEATTEASSARDAINEAVPLRAAAAATPRAPSVAAPRQTFDDPLLEPDGRKWLANLRAALEAATSREEVEAIGAHDTVGNAILNAPPAIKRDISEMLAEHYKRFAEPAADAATDDFPGDLPDLEITGQDKVLAG